MPAKSKKTATEKQLAQRLRFKMAIEFLYPLKRLLNMSFSDRTHERSTGYNQAISRFIRCGLSGEFPNYTLVYEHVLVSRGLGSALSALQWHYIGGNKWKLQWDYMRDEFSGFGDDQIILIVYDLKKQQFRGFEGAYRQDKKMLFELADFEDKTQKVGWVFTMQRDGHKSSTSQYLGVFNKGAKVNAQKTRKGQGALEKK